MGLGKKLTQKRKSSKIKKYLEITTFFKVSKAISYKMKYLFRFIYSSKAATQICNYLRFVFRLQKQRNI